MGTPAVPFAGTLSGNRTILARRLDRGLVAMDLSTSTRGAANGGAHCQRPARPLHRVLVNAKMSAKEVVSVPAIVANAFGKLSLERRARLLGRLPGSVGPLALRVVGGGVFAKYLRNARWPEVPISFEDTARATSSQVHELVRYVEQSNPHLVERLLAAFLQFGEEDFCLE